MKTKWNFLAVFALIVMLLNTACNTDSKGDTPKEDKEGKREKILQDEVPTEGFKDFIVNKWKVTSMDGKGVSEKDKKDFIKSFGTMEFFSDGKFQTISPSGNETGFYELSEGGKILTMIFPMHNQQSQSTHIRELSSDKLVLEKIDFYITLEPF